VDGASPEIDALVKERVRQGDTERGVRLSIYDVDSELIRDLAPTHIITQTQCEVCAVSLADVEHALEAEFAAQVRVVSLQPNALADLWSDIRRIACACEQPETGEQLITDLRNRMNAIEEKAQSAPYQPSVAAMEWLEPLMAAGNWVPELISLAHGRNLFGLPGQHAPWMTWDEVGHANPDIIVALPCGFDLARTRSEMHWLTDRPGWHDLAAARSGNVFLCDGNQFMNRPGPRLVESLQILAEILHPQLFAPDLERIGWERLA
jgi:iron complex transport system substrate-binding protein